MRKVRLGSGAGYSGDRLDPALELIERGNLDYIGFECLAERTIALAHEQMLKDPDAGYNELLEYRMEGILPLFEGRHFKVITNMGAANPRAAAKTTARIAEGTIRGGLKIAAVVGDDILDRIDRYRDTPIIETGKPLSSLGGSIISANAYIGAEAIVQALRGGANIVIGGRIADPSLFLAPLIHEFHWDRSDYETIGKGIMVGHLLECSSQVCGGYFADPGYKEVPDLWNLGFPIAEVDQGGDAIITKLPDTGGLVSAATVKEQALYEIHDPRSYYTPDGIADFSGIQIEEIGVDRVRVAGGSGRADNNMYKVSVGYKDGFIGEAEISYGGSSAYERAKLAGEIVMKRLQKRGVEMDEYRVDIVGADSLYGKSVNDRISGIGPKAMDVRLRVAIRTKTRGAAAELGNEVEALYLNGPAAGGGVWRNVREVIAVASILIPRVDVVTSVEFQEV